MKTRKGYKVYPLTVAQKFHLYYLPFCPSAAVLNIGTSLTIEVELDWDLLKKSINKAYERSEGMRVRFAKDKEGNYYQYVVKHEDQDIEFVDFSNGTMEEAEAKMTEWTRVPFKLEDTQLTRIVMIRMPDGFNGVYFLGHHMIVDAQSLICFLKDIIELYCNAKYEGVPYPKDMCSYIEQIQRDLAYEAGSRAQQRDTVYFQKEIESSEPIYNGIHGTDKLEAARKMFKNPNLRTAFNASDDTTSALDIFHLEAEPTKRLMDFCEKYHVSLACLLLMGLRTYFQKMNGFEDVSINTAIARRATLKEKKSGGTRIHSFPFRTIFPEDMKFIDAVYAIRDKQNEYFRHANYDPTAYFAYRSKTYPQPHAGLTYEPISLTYQPLTLKEKGLDQLGDIRYKTKWYPNGMTAQAMYLTVMHRPEDNGLDFNFEHQIKAVSRDELEYLYYYLCKIMFKGAENPDLTIGDIIKLV
ncbi:peptide synthetase [Lachnoclostridium sp. An169]|uniref:condensation domain-containing protein n=1 Tax=Lachnoclostridium sp. An169 TaxID=1965569 RepID=UPI000B3796AA|nr:peptide synthetase [Lachnoclostridium sp. An169]HJA68342.1 peptide synthetase [Candidatus Mediterraneibacter cottocaccae]